MIPSHRIVTCLPLSDLWDKDGQLEAHRVRRVGGKEISELLRDGAAFVVADVGHPLCWMAGQDRFAFWKAEVKARLVPPEADHFCVEAYASEYCYVASLWHWAGSTPIVVLEKHH